MQIKYYSIMLMSVIWLGCQQDKSPKYTETLEIYSTKGTIQDKTADSLRFFESSEYRGEKLLNTSYFDAKGNLTGKEEILYDKDGHHYKGSFKDVNGKILSYYDYITDGHGQLMAEYGFDASNDQLLSVKTFKYDTEGNVLERSVYEGDHTLYRRYTFGYDQSGNETFMRVTDQKDSLVLMEQFKVTAQDSSGQWTEKWGFVNDIPYTFYKRSKKQK